MVSTLPALSSHPALGMLPTLGTLPTLGALLLGGILCAPAPAPTSVTDLLDWLPLVEWWMSTKQQPSGGPHLAAPLEYPPDGVLYCVWCRTQAWLAIM